MKNKRIFFSLFNDVLGFIKNNEKEFTKHKVMDKYQKYFLFGGYKVKKFKRNV